MCRSTRRKGTHRGGCTTRDRTPAAEVLLGTSRVVVARCRGGRVDGEGEGERSFDAAGVVDDGSEYRKVGGGASIS